jgi:hypothetical protein
MKFSQCNTVWNSKYSFIKYLGCWWQQDTTSRKSNIFSDHVDWEATTSFKITLRRKRVV